MQRISGRWASQNIFSACIPRKLLPDKVHKYRETGIRVTVEVQNLSFRRCSFSVPCKHLRNVCIVIYYIFILPSLPPRSSERGTWSLSTWYPYNNFVGWVSFVAGPSSPGALHGQEGIWTQFFPVLVQRSNTTLPWLFSVVDVEICWNPPLVHLFLCFFTTFWWVHCRNCVYWPLPKKGECLSPLEH